jgi:hypothetical protein
MSKLFFATDLSDYLKDSYQDDEEVVIEFPVFREGKFEHPWHDELTFDTTYLNTLIDNHKRQVFHAKVSLDVSHKPENGAYGWIEDIENGLFVKTVPVRTESGFKDVNLLYARFTLNKQGAQLIKDKVYRYCSSEINTNYTNYEKVNSMSGKEGVVRHGPTLVGVALTNRPFINGLGEISLSNDSKEVILNEKAFISCGAGPGLIFSEADPSRVPEDFMSKSSSSSLEVFSNENFNESYYSLSSKSEELDLTESVNCAEVLVNTENKMKFTELVQGLKSFSSLEEQVEHLKSSRHLLNEEAEVEMFDSLLNAKEEAIQAKIALSEATHRKRLAEEAAENLKLQNAKLFSDLSEAKEGSWVNKVQAFCSKLRQDNHYESLVNKTHEILSSISPENREYKFSTPESDIKFDIMEVLEQLFESMPKEAKVDFSEIALANQEFEVSPEAKMEPIEEVLAEQAPQFEVPEKVLKYSEKYGMMPAKGIWGKITEDGELNLGQ